MARMPGVIWDPLSENWTQAKIRPTQIIWHTAVDAPGKTNLPRYFARADVSVESHFWITLDGEITQMMDTEVRADANRYANRRADGTGAISVETEDEGDPVGVPWTTAQLNSMERIARWARDTHDIPFDVCSGPSKPGQGYHAMWGAPSDWTPSAGKTCPGPTRIKQFHDILIPRLRTVAALQEESIKMNQAQALELAQKLYRALLHREGDQAGVNYWASQFVGKTGSDALITFILYSTDEAVSIGTRLKALEARPVTAGGSVDINAVANEVAVILASRLAG